jgi:hypothetical protein
MSWVRYGSAGLNCNFGVAGTFLISLVQQDGFAADAHLCRISIRSGKWRLASGLPENPPVASAP